MSEILKSTLMLLAPADLADHIERASQLLRVLTHVVESMREEATSLPQLESVVQDEVIDVLCAKFDTLESCMTSGGTEPHTGAQTTRDFQNVIFLARLLQFDLGFQSAWTSKTREVSIQLVSTLFRLAIVRDPLLP